MCRISLARLLVVHIAQAQGQQMSWNHSPTTHQLQHLEQVIYPLSKLQFLRHRNDVKNPTNCSVLPRESNMLLPIQPSACFLAKCKDSIHIQ